jgi:hypothetical protein
MPITHHLLYFMRFNNIASAFFLLFILGACSVLKTGANRFVPDKRVQLKIHSLLAKSVQEQGEIGTVAGDELTLVYSLNGYDEKGNLVTINNGFWGTRTIRQGTTIAAKEFDHLSVHIPVGGKVIAALALLEVDDFKGERKMLKVKPHTRSERYPKALNLRVFDEDRNLPPLDLIDKSLNLAGYNSFKVKQLDFSTNDELGGSIFVYDTDDVGKLSSKAKTGTETLELNGKQVNESYVYVIQYALNVLPAKP